MSRKKKKSKRRGGRGPAKKSPPPLPLVSKPRPLSQVRPKDAPSPTSPTKSASAADEARFVIHISEIVYLKTIFFVAASALFLYMIYLLRGVLTPVLVALAFAYMINPLVDAMQSWGVRRNVAIWLLVFLLFSFVIFGGLVLVPKLLQSLETLGSLLAKVPALLLKWKVALESRFNIHFPKNWIEALQAWGQEIRKYAPQVLKPAKEVISAVFSGSMGLLSGFFTFILIPLFTFYFLKGYESIRYNIVDYIPLHIRGRVLQRLREVDRIISGFIRGQLTVSLIVGSLYMILLSLLKVPLAPAIATGGALLNVVPYLGFLLTFLVALISALVEFHLQWQFFAVLLGMGGIHLLDVLFITPSVVGEQVGLSEIVVIFAVLAGGQLFGVVGVLLAIPLAAVSKVALLELLEHYRNSKVYTGSSS